MLAVPESQKIRLQGLRGKRKHLWEKFEDNPNETRLALELKIIDDQIAEYSQQIQQCNKVLAQSR